MENILTALPLTVSVHTGDSFHNIKWLLTENFTTRAFTNLRFVLSPPPSCQSELRIQQLCAIMHHNRLFPNMIKHQFVDHLP